MTRRKKKPRPDAAVAPPAPAPRRRWPRAVLAVCIAACALFLVLRFVVPRLRTPEIPLPRKGVIDDPEIEAAVGAAVAAVRDAPRDPDAWAALAMTYDANDLTGPAAECYRVAISSRPDVAAWWYDLATVLERDGDFDQSWAALQRAAELDPGYSPMHYSAALWALARGRLDDAEAAARRTVTTSREPARGCIALARVQLERGQDEDAAATLRRAVETWPREWGDPVYARLLLGTALARLGRADEAAPMLANRLVRPPPLPDPWRDSVAERRRGLLAGLGRAARLMEAGRLREAVALYEDLHRRRADSLSAAVDLATAYLMAGRAEDAVALLREASSAHPDAVLPSARLVGALWVAGRRADALQAAEAAVARNPHSYEALAARGDVLLDAGNSEKALVDFEAAARLAPSEDSVLAAVGVARLRLGRVQPAQQAFDEALRRNAENPTAIAGMAIAALRRGDIPAAETWLAKIARVPPQAARLVAEARQARADIR